MRHVLKGNQRIADIFLELVNDVSVSFELLKYILKLWFLETSVKYRLAPYPPSPATSPGEQYPRIGRVARKLRLHS